MSEEGIVLIDRIPHQGRKEGRDWLMKRNKRAGGRLGWHVACSVGYLL